MNANIKNQIREEFDKVTFHKDGTATFKRGFFYRHGMTSAKFGAIAETNLRELGISAQVIETFEEYRAWPKDSYFVARVKLS